MKTTELRITVLILACTLITLFLLSGWWLSRQVNALRKATQALEETQKAHEEEEVKLAMARNERERLESELAIVHADILILQKRMRLLPKHLPLRDIFYQAQHDFAGIQSEVARGRFSGLEHTYEYRGLKRLFDNPAVHAALAEDDETQRPPE